MITSELFGTAPCGTPVHRYTLNGPEICVRIMDYGATVLGVDVTDIPGVEEGDEVVIFSAVPGNTPEDMARVLDTIPYEVMTSVSGRVKRIYSKE